MAWIIYCHGAKVVSVPKHQRWNRKL